MKHTSNFSLKSEEKRAFGTRNRKWEDNIPELKEKACELDSSASGYDPVACSCQHRNQFWMPQNTGNMF
jgi:hypothetical protein